MLTSTRAGPTLSVSLTATEAPERGAFIIR